jgi:hypothetical protein
LSASRSFGNSRNYGDVSGKIRKRRSIWLEKLEARLQEAFEKVDWERVLRMVVSRDSRGGDVPVPTVMRLKKISKSRGEISEA